MGNYLSAGVYSKEKDLSEIVGGISTSTMGIVGSSPRGNIDDLVLVTNSQQFIQEYGYPIPGNYFHYSALAMLENGNKLYCKRVANSAKYGGVKIMQDTHGPNETLIVGLADKTFQEISGEDIAFYVFAKDPGTWNNDIGIRITNIDAVEHTFDIEVYAKNTDGVYEDTGESWTVSRQQKVDGYGKQLYLEDRINGFSNYIAVADDITVVDTVMPTAQATTLAIGGGTVGNTVTSSDVILGWEAFENVDDVDVRVLLNGGWTDATVHTAMKAIAEARKDCVAILDMPYAQLSSVSNMINWREVTQNINSSYTALYAPWVKINDPYNDKIVELPASGYVGSAIAYNDNVGYPWDAAAGFVRGLLNVLGLTNVFTQGERDLLYEAGINPLQTFRGQGNVIWGQKTQQVKASALDRLNVRRSLIVIEKSLVITLNQFVFSQNSVLTRFRVTAVCEEYLGMLSSQGAFQVEGGDRGFRVICDATNNTPAIIDRNELHVDVFVKPSRTAEFIQLQTIITKTGVSFQELVSKGVL